MISSSSRPSASPRVQIRVISSATGANRASHSSHAVEPVAGERTALRRDAPLVAQVPAHRAHDARLPRHPAIALAGGLGERCAPRCSRSPARRSHTTRTSPAVFHSCRSCSEATSARTVARAPAGSSSTIRPIAGNPEMSAARSCHVGVRPAGRSCRRRRPRRAARLAPPSRPSRPSGRGRGGRRPRPPRRRGSRGSCSCAGCDGRPARRGRCAPTRRRCPCSGSRGRRT